MASLIQTLIEVNVAMAFAIVIVALSRSVALKLFDAESAYFRWLLVPFAAVAVMLPAPQSNLAALALPGPASAIVLPSWSAEMFEGRQAGVDAGPATLWLWEFLPPLWALGAGCLAWLILSAQRRFRNSLGRLRQASEYGANVYRTDIEIAGPFLIDLVHPRIIIPRDFEERYEPAERCLVLLHERLHRSRGDLPVNYLAAAITCLCWFNPLVYFAWSMLRRDQELACDGAVARLRPEARKTYGMALLRTARSDRGSPLACSLHKRSVIGERIGQLSRYPMARWRRVLGAFGMVALVGGGSALAWAEQPVDGKGIEATTQDPAILSARSIIQASAPGEERAFPNRERIVVEGAVLIDLLPEGREDIVLESDGRVQVDVTLDGLRIAAATDSIRAVCEDGRWSPGLPVVRLRTPERVKFELHGAGYLHAASVDDFAVTATGCSAVDVQGRIRDLSLIGTGTTRHLLGPIGDSAIILHDRARLASLDAGTGAQLQLNDRSRATILELGDRSTITARQAAVADLGPIGQHSSLRASGSSRILAKSVGRSSSIRLDGEAVLVIDRPLVGSEVETRDLARIDTGEGADDAGGRRIATTRRTTR